MYLNNNAIKTILKITNLDKLIVHMYYINSLRLHLPTSHYYNTSTLNDYTDWISNG